MVSRHAVFRYQLDDICDGILEISRRDERLKVLALRLVESIFPSGEELVDSKIAENLMRFCKPTEQIAHLVTKDITTYLARHGRDRYNFYGHSGRSHMFKWMHELPEEVYQIVAEELLASAIELAKHDAFESCHFSSLFAQT